MKPKQKQIWMLWVHPQGSPGWGQGFDGTRQEAEELAKQLAGPKGKYSIKQVPNPNNYSPTKNHSRP
jgi:hypothetical protein